MPEYSRRGARTTHSADHSHAHVTRLASLPIPRSWIVLAVNAGLAVLFLGFAVTLLPGFSAAELQIDIFASSLRTPVLDVLASAIAVVFSPVANVLIIAALFAYLLFVKRAPVNAAAACFVISVGWLSTQLVKMVVSRARPSVSALHDALLAKTGDDSFPSGHTAFVTALVVGLVLLASERRRLVAVLGGVGILIVAATRVYGGAHYPTDVLGGVLSALTATLIAAGIWNIWGLRVLSWLPFLRAFGPLEPPSDDGPFVHRSTFVTPRGPRGAR